MASGRIIRGGVATIMAIATPMRTIEATKSKKPGSNINSHFRRIIWYNIDGLAK